MSDDRLSSIDFRLWYEDWLKRRNSLESWRDTFCEIGLSTIDIDKQLAEMDREYEERNGCSLKGVLPAPVFTKQKIE